MQEKVSKIILKPNKKFISLVALTILISLINFIIQFYKSTIGSETLSSIVYFGFVILWIWCFYFLCTIFFIDVKIEKDKVIINKNKNIKQYLKKDILLGENSTFALIPTHTIFSFLIPYFYENYKPNQTKILYLLKCSPVLSSDNFMKTIFNNSIQIRILIFYILFLIALTILDSAI